LEKVPTQAFKPFANRPLRGASKRQASGSAGGHDHINLGKFYWFYFLALFGQNLKSQPSSGWLFYLRAGYAAG
jgi:hypothetical protein